MNSNNETSSNYESNENVINEIYGTINQITTKINTIETSMNKKNLDMKDLKYNILKKKSVMEMQSMQIRRKNEELNTLKLDQDTKVQQLMEQIKKIQEQEESLRLQLYELQIYIGKKNEQISQIDIKCKNNIQKLTGQINNLQTNRVSREKELLNRNNKLAKLKEKRNKLNKSVQDLRKKTEELNKKLGQLLSKMNKNGLQNITTIVQRPPDGTNLGESNSARLRQGQLNNGQPLGQNNAASPVSPSSPVSPDTQIRTEITKNILKPGRKSNLSHLEVELKTKRAKYFTRSKNVKNRLPNITYDANPT